MTVTSPVSLKIRPVEPRDNPALCDIIISVLAEFGRSGPGYACNDPETQAMYEAYRAEGSRYYVIEDETTGQVLGGGGFARLKETTPEEGICELQKLYFRTNLRGLGVGHTLLSRLIEEAGALGYREMYLETVPDMEAAIRLYRKLGFEMIPAHKGNTGHAGKCPVYMVRALSVAQVEIEPGVSV